MTTSANVRVGSFPSLPYTGRDVVAIAVTQLGTVETRTPSHPGGNVTPFGSWYGLNGEPWCAMFVSYCFDRAGEPLPISTPRGFAWCPDGVDYFRRHDAWLPAGAVPLPGDLVFYDWSPDDGIDVAEHVGIVEFAAPGGEIHTIEGNAANPLAPGAGGVFRHTRSRGVILGFGRPHYTGHPAPPAWQLDGFRHPSLSEAPGWKTQSSPNPSVTHAQRLLIASGRNLRVDGVFGPKTDTAVNYFQAKHLDDAGHGLRVDGVIGPKTWGALHRVAWHARASSSATA